VYVCQCVCVCHELTCVVSCVCECVVAVDLESDRCVSCVDVCVGVGVCRVMCVSVLVCAV